MSSHLEKLEFFYGLEKSSDNQKNLLFLRKSQKNLNFLGKKKQTENFKLLKKNSGIFFSHYTIKTFQLQWQEYLTLFFINTVKSISNFWVIPFVYILSVFPCNKFSVLTSSLSKSLFSLARYFLDDLFCLFIVVSKHSFHYLIKYL